MRCLILFIYFSRIHLNFVACLSFRLLLRFRHPEFDRISSSFVKWKGGTWKILLILNKERLKFSIYLGLQHTDDMDRNFYKNVAFSFVVESKSLPSYTSEKEAEAEYEFTYEKLGSEGYNDRGFECYFDFEEVQRRVENDEPCLFRCNFYEVRTKMNYSSKKETGMVGLENLGATCYLNALLQMLFHINAFREAVYKVPPNEGETLHTSTVLALQNVFHKLQIDHDQVTTKDLTRAFGWNSLDSFLQQDVQEMMRVLLDKLEEKMKGTLVADVTKKLFAGKVKSYIRCVEVDYESSREEEFYDIQLDVKGCNNLYDSFRKYIEKEMLEGDNKYDADMHGKQDAEKGVIFTKFPPVLTIHLKRFDFDLQRMCFAKVHDKLEYPANLHLDEFLEQSYDESEGPNDYILHSVLVHSGDVNGGHYYAYIRPAHSGFWPDIQNETNFSRGQWFKFDDEYVTKVSAVEAIEKNFGRPKFTNSIGMASAYMLVYIRKSFVINVMKETELNDIPTQLIMRLESEHQLKEVEEHETLMRSNTVDIKYYLEEDVASFCKFNDHQSFVDSNNPRSLQVLKHSSHGGIILEFAKLLGVKAYQLRLWIMDDEHQNTELRVVRDIWSQSILDENFLGDLYFSNRVSYGPFFVEVVSDQEILASAEFKRKFESEMTDLLERELKWIERIQSTVSRKSTLFDVAAGLGLGKSILTLSKRLPENSEDILYSLKREFEMMHSDLIDLLKDVATIYGAANAHSLVFLWVYDEKRHLSDENFRSVFSAPIPTYRYVGYKSISRGTSFQEMRKILLQHFLMLCSPEIRDYWKEAALIRLRKDYKLLREDDDMSTIVGEVFCVESKADERLFENFMMYQRFKKTFSILPVTLMDSQIVHYCNYGKYLSAEDESSFRLSQEKFSLEISTRESTRQLYLKASEKLGTLLHNQLSSWNFIL